jgi:hypothetical protein
MRLEQGAIRRSREMRCTNVRPLNGRSRAYTVHSRMCVFGTIVPIPYAGNDEPQST